MKKLLVVGLFERNEENKVTAEKNGLKQILHKEN